MEQLNDRYVGLKMPTVIWEELKEIAESQGYCTGSFIRSVIYKTLGKTNPEETSATER